MLKRRDWLFDTSGWEYCAEKKGKDTHFDIWDHNPMLKRRDWLFDNCEWEYYAEKKGRDKYFDI